MATPGHTIPSHSQIAPFSYGHTRLYHPFPFTDSSLLLWPHPVIPSLPFTDSSLLLWPHPVIPSLPIHRELSSSMATPGHTVPSHSQIALFSYGHTQSYCPFPFTDSSLLLWPHPVIPSLPIHRELSSPMATPSHTVPSHSQRALFSYGHTQSYRPFPFTDSSLLLWPHPVILSLARAN